MSEYLDASVIVKWFRKEEENHDKSMQLLERIQTMETHFVTSTFSLLEVTRALVKAGEKKDRIQSTYEYLDDLIDIRALEVVKVDEVISLAKDIEIDLTLYASDAIHIASAIHHNCSAVWSEDEHHKKNKTREYLEKRNIEVKSLDELE